MPYQNKIGQDEALARRKWGPTRHQLDYDLIFDNAKIGMSYTQIANYAGVSISTFEANKDWMDVFQEGKAAFQRSIIEEQYNIAMERGHKDQSKMLQHLGKVAVGQSETIKQEQNITLNGTDIFHKLMEQK